jgi:MATE family multidrug resistance protein
MMNSFFVGLIGFYNCLGGPAPGGAGKMMHLVLSQALIFSLCAYPLISCLSAAYRLFSFIGVGSGQLGPQKEYLSILLYGSLITLARTAMSGFFSGIGRTKIVMFASFSAMLANVGLDYLFIFGKLGFPAMGIRGAAYATVIGGVIGLAILFAAYLGSRNRRD